MVKTATKAKTEGGEKKASMNVTFTDDIPKIEREGFSRKSKYTPLLDACVERSPKAARIDVDSQGQASSRASSIKQAAGNHPAEKDDQGIFIVATRSDDDAFQVYVKFAENGSDEYDEEVEARQAAAERAKARKAKKAKENQGE